MCKEHVFLSRKAIFEVWSPKICGNCLFLWLKTFEGCSKCLLWFLEIVPTIILSMAVLNYWCGCFLMDYIVYNLSNRLNNFDLGCGWLWKFIKPDSFVQCFKMQFETCCWGFQWVLSARKQTHSSSFINLLYSVAWYRVSKHSSEISFCLITSQNWANMVSC